MTVATLSKSTAKQKIDKPRTVRSEVFRKISEDLLAMMGLTVIVLMYSVAFFTMTPLWGYLVDQGILYEYDDIDLDNTYAPPSPQHLFGTDELGRDTFSRVVWASRSAAFVSIFVPSLNLILGLFFGILAGHFGGWIDILIMRTSDVLFAFPGLLFVFFIAATLKPAAIEWASNYEILKPLVRQGYVDYIVTFFALSLIGWPGMARLLRGQYLTLRRRDFTVAARALGISEWRIAVRHVLPNAMPPLIIAISGGIGGVIAAEASLSFLGIGLQPPNPSWGQMMSDYYGYWRSPDLWPLLFIPAFILVIIILAFTFLGDGINEAMNPYLD